jgi:4-hydroxy-tetrahydrodipicolinate reductase
MVVLVIFHARIPIRRCRLEFYPAIGNRSSVRKRRQGMAGTKMGVVGCGGRMGRMLVAEIAHTEGCSVAGGSEAPGSGYVNQDIGELTGIGRIGIPIGETVEKVIRDSDVVLEFTSPEATAEHAELAASLGTAMVIGTTGLGTEQGDRVRQAARRIPIVWAPNMSLGVNVLLSVVEEVARRLGPDWDVEIMEMHHRGKVDAPSGTALALGRAAAAGRGVEFEQVEQRARDGITGPRRTGDIGFAALRGGDAVGDHHVIFAGAAERLELTHRTTSRAIYAKGAIRAARWVVGRPPGVYGLKEVLGL